MYSEVSGKGQDWVQCRGWGWGWGRNWGKDVMPHQVAVIHGASLVDGPQQRVVGRQRRVLPCLRPSPTLPLSTVPDPVAQHMRDVSKGIALAGQHSCAEEAFSICNGAAEGREASDFGQTAFPTCP
jgi:hypothetical protein